jgi:hypothetical protein
MLTVTPVSPRIHNKNEEPNYARFQTSEDRESGSLPGRKKPHFRDTDEWKTKKARIIRKFRAMGKMNLALLLARMPVSFISITRHFTFTVAESKGEDDGINCLGNVKELLCYRIRKL